MEQKAFSIKESIKWSASATWRNFGLLFLVTIIPIVLQLSVVWFMRLYAEQLTLMILLRFVTWLVSTVFFLGMIQIGLDIYKQGASRLDRIFIPPTVLLFYVIATVLFGLIVAIPVLVPFVIIMLIYPGAMGVLGAGRLPVEAIPHLTWLVPLVIAYVFFVVPVILLVYNLFDLALVDTHCGPIEALRESARLTRGVRLRLLGLYLALLGIVALSAVTIVGLLFTIPMTIVARVYVYRKLKEARG